MGSGHFECFQVSVNNIRERNGLQRFDFYRSVKAIFADCTMEIMRKLRFS